MIRSFRHRETKRLYQREVSRKLPLNVQKVARRKLRMLNQAKELQDIRIPPANQLERLKGNRKGQLSIRINDQWRICFRWKSGDVYDVEIVDYH